MNRGLWRVLLGLAVAVAGVAAVAEPAPAAGVATASFVKSSAWDTGYVGVFTMANGTAGPLTWQVEFDLPAGTVAGNFWGARITRTGDHYLAVGESWNATVAAGGSTNFGYVAGGTGGPLNCRLNGGSCTGTGGGADIRPPTTPGNLRGVVATNTFTLRWDASSDDAGVSGYEVYVGANLAATVTGTEYSMPTPPPMVITYRVRALDAAGNASAFAVITPGGPADTVAPSAPPSLSFGGGTNGFTLTWGAATDNVAVAGYDVYINGEHYGPTSRTSLTVPPVGFGGFTFSVVAFDGAGLRSAAITRMVAIDPGPNSDARSPTVPADLRVSISATTVTWTWTASTDNVSVSGYQIFHGADWGGNVAGTTYSEPRPAGQTTFGIRVRAFDAAGNKSSFATLTVVLDPPPPTPVPGAAPIG
ncbi:cellulose binding domain-containing protein [Dactylosporangium sp. CA-139066]|uniref:cellulose binding domain-containing protein n=1 Tax=Dactylosporangium sp. CA-139066 TaxID=3239930 RepID=UPI003D8CE384